MLKWTSESEYFLSFEIFILDVHRTHTPRCEVKKIIALWRMHAVMQGWKEVGCED